jgi:hypothetical protein
MNNSEYNRQAELSGMISGTSSFTVMVVLKDLEDELD